MMLLLLGLLGFLVIGYVLLDVLWTTFLEGGAPLTTRVSAWVAGLTLMFQCELYGRDPGASLARRPAEQMMPRRRPRSRRLIAASGLFVVVATVLCWGVLLWAGWALVFCSRPRALVAAD